MVNSRFYSWIVVLRWLCRVWWFLGVRRVDEWLWVVSSHYKQKHIQLLNNIWDLKQEMGLCSHEETDKNNGLSTEYSLIDTTMQLFECVASVFYPSIVALLLQINLNGTSKQNKCMLTCQRFIVCQTESSSLNDCFLTSEKKAVNWTIY